MATEHAPLPAAQANADEPEQNAPAKPDLPADSADKATPPGTVRGNVIDRDPPKPA